MSIILYGYIPDLLFSYIYIFNANSTGIVPLLLCLTVTY